MRWWAAGLGLLLWGCNTATPVPDWTPPRSQLRPEAKSDQKLAETPKQKLPVKASPPRRERRALLIGNAPPAAPQELVPRSEPSAAYPQHQPRAAQAPPSVGLEPGAEAPAGVDFSRVSIDQFLGLSANTSCDVVLVVDVSGSVFQQGVEVAVEAAAKVYARQSANDRVWVIAFGSQPEMVVNGHGGAVSREQLARALTGSNPANSGTLLAPAIEMAVYALSRSTQARRVVVVSDGILGDSQQAVWQAVRASSQREIAFSTIHIGSDWSGAATLQEISAQTRGRFLSVADL